MSGLFDNNDDIDDEIPEFDADGATEPSRENAAQALAALALETALARQARAAIKRQPTLVIMQVPSSDWTHIIAAAVKRMDRAPVVRSVIERVRKGGVDHRMGEEELSYLRQGLSVLYISQNPKGLLHEAVLSSVDVTVTIPDMTQAMLRKLIRRVTGGVARGVNDDMVKLDLSVILSTVRSELTAGECVANLRRAVSRRPEPTRSAVPMLTDLPLTKAVRTWADQTLSDLDAVGAGSLAPAQLVFALLEGPPGTGKTLIAESLAQTSGWTFVPSSVGAWFATGDGALGGVAKNLKAFVDQVLASEPAIGFLDELDALPNRATIDNRGRDWWTPVITLFLTEIDRLRSSGRQILLLGASNYYERLDAALIRPGRMQQRVSVQPPQTDAEVCAVLRHYLKSDLTDADLGRLARIGRGATPAMVEGWVKQARSLARAENRPLKPGDLLVQIVPDDHRTPEDIRTIAIHEMGHAVVAHRLGHTVESVSIIPAGETGGRVWSKLVTTIPTWQGLLDIAAVNLGGRAADIVLGDGPNAGAESDLANATALILSAYERQGLRDSLVSAPVLSMRAADTFLAVDSELRRQLRRAMTIVRADREQVAQLVEKLIEDRVLSGEDVANGLGTRTLDLPAKRRNIGAKAPAPPRHGVKTS